MRRRDRSILLAAFAFAMAATVAVGQPLSLSAVDHVKDAIEVAGGTGLGGRLGSAPRNLLDLNTVADWISATPLSVFMRGTRSSFPMFGPFVLVLHLLGVSIVTGVAVVVGLRLQGFADKFVSVSEVTRGLLPWLWLSLPVLVVTGVTVLSNHSRRYLHNPNFQLKMVLLFAAVILTLTVHRVYGREGAIANGWTAKLMGVALIGVWIAILFAGRWIAYAN